MDIQLIKLDSYTLILRVYLSQFK